jgi:hypothetical protein
MGDKRWHGSVNVWVNGFTDGWICGCMDRGFDGLTEGGRDYWMQGWMDGWIDVGEMDGWAVGRGYGNVVLREGCMDGDGCMCGGGEGWKNGGILKNIFTTIYVAVYNNNF